MFRQLIVLTSLAAGLAASFSASKAVAGEPVPLVNDSLKTLVPGTRIALDTPLGMVVAIHFAADGLVSGEANELASYLGAKRDRGRWRIDGDTVCIKWFRWFDAEERCITMQQQDDRIFWQGPEGKSGTATIVERGPGAAKSATQVAAAVPRASPAAPASVPAAPSPPAPAPSVEAATAPPTFIAATATAPALSPPTSASLPGLTIISRAEAATPAEPAAPIEATAPPAKPTPKAVSKRVPKQAPASKQAAAKPHAKSDKKTATSIGKPAAPATAKPEATYQVARVGQDDVLNVRDGPSEDNDPIGEIPPEGRGVKLLGACRNDWCPVSHGGIKGWVNSYYLTPESKVAAAARSSERR